ncbi:TetR family transcriptional regulator C-terminal domain-containing protein [Streptomyces sp. NPDC050619]|uniref:TetR/AcrR family transcriptional regulator n=1 Tax=Streptomyces sp. NPDC050619 TaxID=3157214 RepID=UPI00344AEC81
MSATQPTARSRRLSPAERRQEIIEAAAALALEEGLAAVTYRGVAARLGCAPGLVHHYFDVVEALEAEAFTHAVTTDFERTFQEVEELGDAVEGLRHMLRVWVSESPEPHKTVWLDAWYLAARKPRVHAAVDHAMRTTHGLLVAVLERGLREEHFAPHDPDALAWQLLTALDGVIVHSSLGVNRGIVDVRRTIARFTETALGLERDALASAFDD